MKTNLLSRARPRKIGISLAGAVEWAALVALVAVVVFLFLRNEGFIDASDIQPFPY